MTPLQLKMMLHYATCSGTYSPDDPRHANSPEVGEQRQILIELGLLERFDIAACIPSFKATEKGHAYVRFLCEMELPVCKWVMP